MFIRIPSVWPISRERTRTDIRANGAPNHFFVQHIRVNGGGGGGGAGVDAARPLLIVFNIRDNVYKWVKLYKNMSRLLMI